MPDDLPVLWRRPLKSAGIGGLAATPTQVIVSDRDLADQSDVFHCLDAKTGKTIWTQRYAAPGRLDYGNSPRATPLIDQSRVYTLSAFGYLSCLDLDSGKILWRRHLPREFQLQDELTWGMTSSPLMVDGKLIVSPGAPQASLVALNPKDGGVVWQTSGELPGHGSMIERRWSGGHQVIGYDAVSLGAWDAETGERLWTYEPPNEGDFNVPTPLLIENRLLIMTENNGTRLFDFQEDGLLNPVPVAQHRPLSPDTMSPTAVGGRLYGCHLGLYCLDLKADLSEVWYVQDPAFDDSVSLIASNDRLLVTSITGELLLLDITEEAYRLVSRLKAFDDDFGVYSHPAIVDQKLYVRGSLEIVCLDLGRTQ